MPATVTLRPNIQGTFNDFALGAGSTKVVAVSDELDTTYNVPNAPADYDTYGIEDIPSPGGSLVSSVVVYARIEQVGAGFTNWTPRLYLNGVSLDGTLVAHAVSGILETSQSFTTKPGGGVFTVFDVNALEIGGNFNWSSAPSRLLDIWAIVTYNPIPANLERVRVIGTQRLMLRRRPRSIVKVTGPLRLLDAELLDLLPWSHRNGPHEDGEGWGVKTWQRRPSRLLQSTLDLNTLTVSVSAQDWRDQFITLYDEGRSLVSSSSFANGVARMYVGTRTYERDSKAWVEDPSDDTVRELGYDVEILSGGEFPGQLIESTSTNMLTRSSFVSGETGLTIADGVNGSDVALDSGDLLFDTSVTPTTIRLTAGTPHTTEDSVSWPATASIPANTICRLSVDHKDDSGVALAWRMFRGVDSRFWNDTTETWDVGAVTNTMTMSTTKERWLSKRFDVGSSATTVAMGIAQTAGGTAGRINHVYHVQLEKLAWATSRIVTDSASVTRADASLSYSQTTSALANWPHTRGTVTFDFIPEWDRDDLMAGGMSGGVAAHFFVLPYSGSNDIFHIFFDAITGYLNFVIGSGGVNYGAVHYDWNPVRGQTYKIAARWTSSEGELGLAPLTASVFVDGVKGASEGVFVSPTAVYPSTLYVGSNVTTYTPNGAMRRIRITQQVLTDEEIARA